MKPINLEESFSNGLKDLLVLLMCFECCKLNT